VPVSSITVVPSSGERSVVSVDASSITIRAVPDLRDLTVGTRVVLVDGHHPALAAEAARVASAESIPLVLDAGRWRPIMEQLVPRAGAVICSANFRWPGTDSVASSARAVVEQGVSTVVVTLGAAPAATAGSDLMRTVFVHPSSLRYIQRFRNSTHTYDACLQLSDPLSAGPLDDPGSAACVQR
jgi:sugar/nucleoside kinase (ribokinase family)